ncbi:hypothetical protein HPB50_028256 [Hyalomma asiaticum]|nr:hypothetical protein HPB50_028256 [Hyalomma asiaticum]
MGGLDDCTTKQPSKPLVFAMQTTFLAFAGLLLSTVARLSPGASSVLALPGSDSEPEFCRLPLTKCSTPPDAPPGELRSSPIALIWMAKSSSSTAPTCIMEPHPLTALRGLGDCTTMQPPKPLTFAMQVTQSYVLFAKKSSNYFLVQFPSPNCCISVAIECVHAINSLLMLSGDIETNPGPNGNAAVFAALQKPNPAD